MRKINCDSASCFFCKTCPNDWIEFTRLKKQSYLLKKGESLYYEDTPANGMYFILSGIVKVHKQWGDKDLILRFAKDGDIIGLRGFGELKYRATATALSGLKVCFIPTDHMVSSMRINSDLSFQILQLYATELQVAEQRMSDLAHKHVKNRIADTLLLLSNMFGTDANGFLDITISRQDIASFAGTTYETVFKIFTEWISLNYIKTEGKRMKILNMETIQSFKE